MGDERIVLGRRKMKRKAKTKVVKLNLTRVSFVDEGANPGADIEIFKLRDTPVQKDEHGARSFDEVQAASLAYDTGAAIDGRLWNLSQSVFEILFDEETEGKAAAIRESVEQFSNAMDSDVDDLLAGRLLKALDGEGLPTVGSILKHLTEQLSPEGTGETDMGFDISKLPEDARGHILQLTLDRNTAAGEATVAKAENETLTASIDKAKDKPEPDEDIFKGMTSEQAKFVKALQDDRAADSKLVAGLVQKGRKVELVVVAKGFGSLAKSADEIAGLLVKAEKAEVLDEVVELLTAAQEMVTKSGGLEEVGSSQTDIDGGDGDAMGKVTKMAKVLTAADPTLSEEAAITKVLQANPKLYDEYEKGLN